VLGIPADLLRRRPDVRRAEREIAAQSARIGIAESALYPAFTINGNVIVRANQFQHLFNSNAVGGSIGPSFNWNLLNYGRIGNNVAAQEARFMQEVTQYQNVVLNANREAEDAIVAFLRTQEQARSLKQASDAALESRNLIQELYSGGTADFGRVFVAELVLAQQQDALAIAEGNIATSLVQVFGALGGGWQIRLEPNPEHAAELIPTPNPEPAPMPNPDPAPQPNPEPAPQP
jgi:outer membrane protein TolC